MRKNVLFLALGLLLAGCQREQEKSQSPVVEAEVAQEKEWQSFGAQINPEGAIEAEQVPALLAEKDSVEVKLTARAISSCSKKGCWMKVNIGEEEVMRVTFKDYGFFVPKDLTGGEVVLEGILQKTVTDVATLRHYAMDEGASPEELAQITAPEEEYSFEATGVLIR
ncbi:DUF4920 domain-containing protein [Nafulsella turpanensis]|uniref:DUF4920 domain-containing protein n=1 Tax=Nafulsella turpanensis TaxID=1265690 RepID=UPI000349E2A6|nr:DUF4920 domain-containing protein [Nafulsella turpanensis]